ncbi:hypothetical protein FIBSPDRAFT_506862 [Athelia psychrophila]|uniref:Uncharacterized protein n=1 Tax=Athelia psychrophila TaxID=1759441 RepID=A0A166K136_9AGAM|nr:hypothetical protein FIBSPDRAFT_506862 [Fibularhizoctonia sp. CBS 109695]
MADAVWCQTRLGRLLRALGTILEELSIQRSPGFPSAPVISYEHLDLRHNNWLEVLSFWGCSLSVIQSQFLTLAYQVASSHLRELHF